MVWFGLAASTHVTTSIQLVVFRRTLFSRFHAVLTYGGHLQTYFWLRGSFRGFTAVSHYCTARGLSYDLKLFVTDSHFLSCLVCLPPFKEALTETIITRQYVPCLCDGGNCVLKRVLCNACRVVSVAGYVNLQQAPGSLDGGSGI